MTLLLFDPSNHDEVQEAEHILECSTVPGSMLSQQSIGLLSSAAEFHYDRHELVETLSTLLRIRDRRFRESARLQCTKIFRAIHTRGKIRYYTA
jgi:hypothetical protein